MNYDLCIIGGGLAGLALSIDMSKRGHKVIVIEKGNYPRHKVCGEYISMESHRYLLSICPALNELSLPTITNFKLTSGVNKEFTTEMKQGGFGISRYLLEELLFNESEKQGVEFLLNTKAKDVSYNQTGDNFNVKINSDLISATLVCDSTGRRSNLKIEERDANHISTNYVGVKYHIKIQRDPKFIEIHNFPGGYCGISNIEDGKSCLCYIVNSRNLKLVNNSISELEKHFLFENSNLKKTFSEAEFIFKGPVTISGIDFRIKEPIKDHVIFLGDSAGTIAPITGNGMSIGLRSAFVLANELGEFLSKKINRQQLEKKYANFWNKEFASRIKISRHLQKLSEYPFLAKRTIELFNLFPVLAKGVIKQTHGKPF